jgi:hypothetical protein
MDTIPRAGERPAVGKQTHIESQRPDKTVLVRKIELTPGIIFGMKMVA